ncbi:MAG: DsbA family protein [Halieaceae bacterium]|jgi:2-hydroxychromene-2-carboxylate isomerase|nr:DsbA family protein [Halieaceae bacterium]
MAEQFKEQGGVATMDPSWFRRWMTSRIMTRAVQVSTLEEKRRQTEQKRRAENTPHRVLYFHQVDDGYSHLAAQLLAAFASRYDVELQCYLVRGPTGANAPEPDLLSRLSRYEAFHIAPGYGLAFPQHEAAPHAELIRQAEAILAAQDSAGFIGCATAVGEALWNDDVAALAALAEAHGAASDQEAGDAISAGEARRRELKHYSGAMFYYGGEWYWGVDRLYHLEERLAGLGADLQPGAPLLAPRPEVDPGPIKDAGTLTLEIFPSLRSPYTAVVFDRAVQLAADSGVKLVMRPVLPMVMRGVPATREKGFYIFTDTAREARAAGVPFGNFYDPIGNPVRNCYSLYPWAEQQGKGVELFSSFLRYAFAEGVNTNRQSGLRRVVEAAGLDWQEARQHLGDPSWEALLEQNRLAMYEAGLWGVPSFRLLDAAGRSLLAIWGQDRLWLVAQEIRHQLAAKAG